MRELFNEKLGTINFRRSTIEQRWNIQSRMFVLQWTAISKTDAPKELNIQFFLTGGFISPTTLGKFII